MTNQQIRVLDFVASNPGCCAMDVVRAVWGARGHAAEYLRIKRLVRAGKIRKEKGAGNRLALFVVA